ncbi:MAG: LPS-assembly protein LptD [Hyphomicrobiales bacterium]|nr:LPS-assembly protein LptD [Hyphomicrobiales bacterium]
MKLKKLSILDLESGFYSRSNCSGKCFCDYLRLTKAMAAGAAFMGVMFTSPQLSQQPFALSDGISAKAQSITGNLISKRTTPDAQMLLEADQLQYDDANNSVSAVGNVQIAYDGFTLVAKKITYYHASGRVIAQGNVVIVEPNGNRIYAEEIDITDNFSDGFVTAMQIETAENTRFAADSAERVDGNLTILNNGVYTACEVCKEDPTKPPLWQIRARKVMMDKNAKRISYEKASFELFGKPIAYLPYFSHADPSIKRKSGFMIPSTSISEHLGFGLSTGYFFNLAPNYDLTLSSTYYTRQGFLGMAEWRHRTQNGAYNLTAVGIEQEDNNAFDPGTYDRLASTRYALQSSGRFAINQRWTFGWQYLLQSDRNFSRTYVVTSQTGSEVTNSLYLTGLSGKNFFDMRAQKILLQELDPTESLQGEQAGVLPLIDHNYVLKTPVANGQLSYNFNMIGIDRHNDDIENSNLLVSLADNERHRGIAGEHTRASANLEWKSKYITDTGLLITPSLHGQVDALWLNKENPNSASNPLLNNQSLFRAMPTAGLEIRYPLIAQDGFASHIFEPIAQIFAGTDETRIGQFPNEDAQSMVFDTTNLFTRNRFSGYDRIEGGIRANVGFRYSANFVAGGGLDVVAGQSFHLAGQNSFAQRDLVNAGVESGLDTDRSDYVVSAQVNSVSGISFRTGARFDENSFDIRRTDIGTTFASPNLTAGVNYSFIDAQPNYGFTNDRHEVTTTGSVKFADYWRAFGAVTHDMQTNTIVSDSIGIAYDDSCFSFSIAFKENRQEFTNEQVNQSISFRLGFRTIGNYDYKHNLENGVE